MDNDMSERTTFQTLLDYHNQFIDDLHHGEKNPWLAFNQHMKATDACTPVCLQCLDNTIMLDQYRLV